MCPSASTVNETTGAKLDSHAMAFACAQHVRPEPHGVEGGQPPVQAHATPRTLSETNTMHPERRIKFNNTQATTLHAEPASAHAAAGHETCAVACVDAERD